MKVHAFVPAAQPDWVQASVYSYYRLVERIIVSYDRDGLGWNGKPMPVDTTLALLRDMDIDNKMVFCPGNYFRPNHAPHENATYQRQCALDEAGDNANWVLMFDTDEVLADPVMFKSCLEQAHTEGFDGLHYPARWLYQYLGRGWFLEMCSRFWGIAASYPGPVAIRPRTRLTHHRQCDVSLFRVDFKPRNTDPWHRPDATVNRVIGADQGIIHYSYVRRPEYLEKKFANHGEFHNPERSRKVVHWEWCARHPYLASARTPLALRRYGQRHLRPVRITAPNDYALRELNELNGTDNPNPTHAKALVEADRQ